MQKLSVIAFSRNDIDKALKFVAYIYEYVDDIVIVDASDDKEWKSFNKQKEKLGYGKLRLYHTVAMGYPEPVFMYAYGKCKHEWVLYLDTDERLSDELARDLRKIIGEAKCDAFAIKRYEKVSKGKLGTHFTWQIHLSKAGKTVYKGLIHEQPIINGRIEMLDNADYYITHEEELMRHTESAFHEYNAMDKFERLSYSMYKAKMLDYAAKALTPTRRDISGTLSAAMITGLINVPESLRRMGEENEISLPEYFFMYYLRDLRIVVSERNLGDFWRLWGAVSKRVNLIKRSMNEPDGKEIFEISKIIHSTGLTQYLNLDDEKELERLDRLYRGKKQGVTLLMDLLKSKYELQHHNANV